MDAAAIVQGNGGRDRDPAIRWGDELAPSQVGCVAGYIRRILSSGGVVGYAVAGNPVICHFDGTAARSHGECLAAKLLRDRIPGNCMCAVTATEQRRQAVEQIQVGVHAAVGRGVPVFGPVRGDVEIERIAGGTLGEGGSGQQQNEEYGVNDNPITS